MVGGSDGAWKFTKDNEAKGIEKGKCILTAEDLVPGFPSNNYLWVNGSNSNLLSFHLSSFTVNEILQGWVCLASQKEEPLAWVDFVVVMVKGVEERVCVGGCNS